LEAKSTGRKEFTRQKQVELFLPLSVDCERLAKTSFGAFWGKNAVDLQQWC
jgi:hypothetical protein